MPNKIIYTKDKEEQRNRYSEYINEHIKNVEFCYFEYVKCFKEIFPSVYAYDVKHTSLINNIRYHDLSKYSEYEFEAYANKFYPILGIEEDKEKIKSKFNYAWLHHVHSNPHHPMYWVLVEENKEIVILDMPDIYIIEMLCDWMAMSKHFNSSTFEYWNAKGNKLPLSFDTRFKIDKFMQYMNTHYKDILW